MKSQLLSHMIIFPPVMLINFGKQSRDWAFIILGESFIDFIPNIFLDITSVPDITNTMSIMKVFHI